MTADCHLANLANLAELHLRRPLFKGTDPQIRSSMQALTTAPSPLPTGVGAPSQTGAVPDGDRGGAS